jgi:integrase/recombinase XerD
MKRKTISLSKITIADATIQFLHDCRARGLSLRTEIYYQESINKFTRTMKTVDEVKKIDKVMYDNYLVALRGSNAKPQTILSNVKGLRVFLNWCFKLDYLKPFFMIKPKATKEVKETYTDEELKKLLTKPSKKEIETSFTDYRTWVMINYLMATGNRASTMVNLKVKDVDLFGGFATLRTTKNNKDQIIPLASTITKILIEYIKLSQLSPDDWLFPSVYNQCLAINAVHSAIKRYNNKHGVLTQGTHLFRHTFAKKWIMGGGDIFSLQKMMGHADLEILQEYVHLFSVDVKVKNDQFNPLNNIVLTQTKKTMKK